jgi:chloramphenicol-sensitive protein RarD
MTEQMIKPRHKGAGGLGAAVLAYVLWGFFPIYFHPLASVPAVELVSWRVIFTLPICLVVVVWSGQGAALRAALTTPAILGRLVLSAAAIGCNWLIYLYSVETQQVLAASLGYYINPLLNVLIGVLFLKERLNRLQWAAVILAVGGIAVLLAGALPMLGMALGMAASFALYGLVRKFVPVPAVIGLTVETAVLFVPAALAVVHASASPSGNAMMLGGAVPRLLAASGVITAGPLLLFAVAARKLDLSTLGFVQFISPTILFVLGAVLYGEPLDAARVACFTLIWCAIALFSYDLFRRR